MKRNSGQNSAEPPQPSGVAEKEQRHPDGDSRAYFIKYDGSERQYMPSAQACATIRALAFASCREAAYGNRVDGICGRLSDEEYYNGLRSLVRKAGLTTEEERIASAEKCHQIVALCWQVGEWKAEAVTDDSRNAPHVALNGEIAIYPVLKNGIGRMCYFVYAVQSLEIDDADPEFACVSDAITNAAERIETARVRYALSKAEVQP